VNAEVHPGADSILDFRVRLATPERPQLQAPPEYTSQYDAVLDVSARSDLSTEDLLAEMAAAGVARAVVHAEHEHGDIADELNSTTARVVGEHPGVFVGFGTACLEPLRVMRAVRQVQAAGELGLVGINLQPSFVGMSMTDRRLYPVYAKAEELGMVVALHTGVNYTTHQPIANDHPLQLDQVACDFPGLLIVACHAGWPFTAELVAVMRKHPNVFADFGGLAPKYVSAPDTGWSVMRRFMNSLLRGQVLYATDWPVFPMARAVAEWRSSGLRDEVLTGLFGANAERLLELAGIDIVSFTKDTKRRASC
jgi:uncharacterized protein